ncbi:hypothetical protein AYK24_08285 [Thermoplasmatales archaeon SG8-52-4]|nr:MAG: hypothetical protein AYK24_08285 [Thermoplasmatales archaeon SG8-52-4]
MKRQIVILVLAILFILTIFSGCFGNNNDEENKFIGTWKHGTIPTSRPIIFSKNSNCDYLGDQATWELKNGKLVVNLIDLNDELIFDYEFLDNNKILILTNTGTDPPQINDYVKQ